MYIINKKEDEEINMPSLESEKNNIISPIRMLSLLEKTEQLNFQKLDYTQEQLAKWENACINPEKKWFLSYYQLLCILDSCRINSEKSTADLISLLKERSCASLSRSLFNYWQNYYENSTVKQICRQYLERKSNCIQEWENEWKVWISSTDPAKTMINMQQNHSFRELQKKYRLRPTFLFSQRVEIFYYMLGRKENLTLKDRELLHMTRRLLQDEKTEFLEEMLKKFPIIRKNGNIDKENIYQFTKYYKNTVTYLLTESKKYLETTDDALLHLLNFIMSANQISNAEHSRFWCEEFLETCQEDEKWQLYGYFMHENILELLCPDGQRILDFWDENILLILPKDASPVFLSSAEVVQKQMHLSEENIITGHNWKQKIQLIIRKINHEITEKEAF